jgi:hypothetical protein
MIDNNNISIGSNNITMNEIQKPHTNKASFDLHLASTENIRRFTEKSKENNVREQSIRNYISSIYQTCMVETEHH